MLPRLERLTSSQFDNAFARAQSVRHPLIVLRAHVREDGDAATRAAFVVPKKQGKATVRNQVRRRVRERYRLHPRRSTLVGCDLIFLSTPATHTASDAQLDAALEEVLRRMSKKTGGKAPARNSVLPSVPEAETQSEVETQSGETVVANCVTNYETEAETRPNAPAVTTFAALALTLIRFYQRFISPGLPPSCRFLPTCSHYTYQAIERFGVARGLWLGAKRVCRCNPFHPGGIDPVPEFSRTRSR